MSTISKKKCKCSDPECNFWPDMGFEGYSRFHAPKEVLDRLDKRQKRKNAAKLGNTKLRSLSKSDVEVNAPKGYKSKSELLREADRLFSIFIRNRDSDKNGNVACVCCGKIYNIADKDSYGNKIIQNLHFVKRDVYSLRFDEDNGAAGCTWCNKDMNDSPKGKAYQQYREVLVDKIGEVSVAEMELAHRKINRIEASQLKTVIEHYGINNE